MSLALRHTDLRIQAERVWLDALLSHAPDVRGLLVCAAPGFGRLRESREDHAARVLRDAGFATLLVSMLTPYEEARDPDVRFDVSLLDHRLQALFTWIAQQPTLAGLPLGLLAVGTVAAAAVRLLARDNEAAAALVIRAGRPDLAGAEPLRRLRTPVLLVAPGAEGEANRPAEQAFALLGGTRKWAFVSHASASFIEPGALEAGTQAAREWFSDHMPPPRDAETPQLGGDAA